MSQQEQKPPTPELITYFGEKSGLGSDLFEKVIAATTKKVEGISQSDIYTLLEVARKYDLNPATNEIYAMKTGNGVKVVIPIDGYLVFLHRAEKSGQLKRHEYVEGWWPDPRYDPEGRDPKTGKPIPVPLRRGGRVTMWLVNDDKPREHTTWFDEEYNNRNTNWNQRSSLMLQHRTYSRAIRYQLGLYVMDADEASALMDSVLAETTRRQVEERAAARAEPAVPIRTVSRVPVAPAPPDLEEQGNPGPSGDPAASTSREVGASSESPAAPASPAPPAPESRPFDDAESRRLDAEMAAEAEKPRTGLFEP